VRNNPTDDTRSNAPSLNRSIPAANRPRGSLCLGARACAQTERRGEAWAGAGLAWR